MIGICLCVTRETIDAVDCIAGVFTTLFAFLEPDSEASSLFNLDCWSLSAWSQCHRPASRWTDPAASSLGF